MVTRGISYKTLDQFALWKHGPPWITSEAQWPKWNHTEVLTMQIATEDEEQTQKTNTPSVQAASDIHQIIDIRNYNNLNRLLRVSPYVIRFVKNLKQLNSSLRQAGPLQPDEISKALQNWIHHSQQTMFSSELHNLQSKSSNAKYLPLVRQLSLFLDKNHIIHCGEMVHNAPVGETTKFSIILPKKHQLTSLATHKDQLHGGVNSTVTALRQCYWIPSAQQLVRKLLKNVSPTVE